MTDKNDHIEEELWFSSITEEELSKYNKDAAFAAFQQRVAESRHRSSLGARLSSIHLLKYVAAVAAMIVIGFFSFKEGQHQIESAFGDIVVESPQGSRAQVTLPDSTKVWLNAGSRISYTQGFGCTIRLVKLVGEGYFEVAHNEQLPFSVMSDDVEVKVLGTKFNVRDYSSDAEATVSLIEGSIAMASTKQPKETIQLIPGQQATIDKKTGKINIETRMVENAIQWTKGHIIFDGEPLSVIAKDLERCYNVKVNISSPNLLSLRFYGEFVRQEQGLNEILEALSATGKIRYKVEGQIITLY